MLTNTSGNIFILYIKSLIGLRYFILSLLAYVEILSFLISVKYPAVRKDIVIQLKLTQTYHVYSIVKTKI
jgi:hypothetical protein